MCRISRYPSCCEIWLLKRVWWSGHTICWYVRYQETEKIRNFHQKNGTSQRGKTPGGQKHKSRNQNLVTVFALPTGNKSVRGKNPKIWQKSRNFYQNVKKQRGGKTLKGQKNTKSRNLEILSLFLPSKKQPQKWQTKTFTVVYETISVSIVVWNQIPVKARKVEKFLGKRGSDG